jgi:choline-glycine betaine transporter
MSSIEPFQTSNLVYFVFYFLILCVHVSMMFTISKGIKFQSNSSFYFASVFIIFYVNKHEYDDNNHGEAKLQYDV